MSTEYLKNILLSKLYYLGIIKNGKYKLKSGAESNIYLDLRKLISHPTLYSHFLHIINHELPDIFAASSPLLTTKLMPIPYGGLALSNYISFIKNIPSVFIRDKVKEYGTGNIIEGEFDVKRDEFIIIDDVITSGTSILETLEKLKTHGIDGLQIKMIITLVNRNHNSLNSLNGIPIYSVFNLDDINNYTNYLQNNIISSNNVHDNNSESSLEYLYYKSKHASKLYEKALKKRSNIILSCDSINMIYLLEVLKDKIVGVKLHGDFFTNKENSFEMVERLSRYVKEYDLEVIDDAKLCDIESIEEKKIENQIGSPQNELVTSVTKQAFSGLSILNSKKTHLPDFLVITEMSSACNMISPEYTRNVLTEVRFRSHDSENKVLGLICQNNTPQLLTHPFEFLTMSPGINLSSSTGDNGTQTYKIPDQGENKVGLFWIVGRGITNGYDINEIVNLADKYRYYGWKYFLEY